MISKIKKLGDLLDIQNGYAFPSKKFSFDTGIPLIRIRDISNGYETQVNFDGEYDNKYIVKKGDLLIGMDGEFKCYDWKGKNSLLNQRVCRLQNFSELLHPKFLFYGINKYLKEIEDKTEYTTVKHISSTKIKNIKFPLFSINEQKRIVKKLDTCMEQIDKAIQNVEQNIQNSEDFLQSSLDSIIFNNSFSNKKMINNLCEFNRGLTFSKIDRVENSSFKVLRANNIHLDDYKINFEKLQFLDESKSYNESKKIRKNSVLMCISSGSKKHLGKIAFIDDHYDNYYFGGFMGQLTPLKDINPKYFFYCLKTSDFKYLIQSLTDGMGINNLKYDSIKSFEIPTISIDKQDALVNQIEQTISNHDSLKFNYNQQLTSLNELKQSILEKAFNGEL